MDEHLMQVVQRVRSTLAEVETGEAAPSTLLAAARLAEGALDGQHMAWKRTLGDLCGFVASALNPFPPAEPGDSRRREVLHAAEEFRVAADGLLAQRAGGDP